MKFDTLKLLTFTSGVGCTQATVDEMCLIGAQLAGGTHPISVFSIEAYRTKGAHVVGSQIKGWPPAACVDTMLDRGPAVFRAFCDRVVETFGAEVEITLATA